MVDDTTRVSGQQEARAMPLLRVENLAFGYTDQTLLYGVQMSVCSGEMVGLLGPNGSGKTTLLRLLSGVLQPRAGRITLDERELSAWGRRGIAQRVAVVPQELQVPFAFTVEQMVALGRTPFVSLFGNRTSRDHEITREAMRLAEVDGLAERIFHELSGGERQRVTLAMALAQQPRLLLLDEPTSHLDIKYQIETLELVRRLNRETGVTVLAAMHDLNLAARYFPRLLLFQRGIVADGGPAEVLEPRLLQRVYGITVQVGVMRGAEHLSVLPPGEDMANNHAQNEQEAEVHVMAGGGSGALLMRALADARIAFSAGVLNIGDSDYTLALRLASAVIPEHPFSPISESTRQHLQRCLQAAKLLIICPMPLGPGNLILLQGALELCQRGVPVLLLLPPGSREKSPLEAELSPEVLARLLCTPARDYAHGDGTRLLRQLIEFGATVVASVGEAAEHARQMIAANDPAL
ncbi:MAG TPA: ABC transporter ATP-binding protein [Ktedonobacteraceae bacterium]